MKVISFILIQLVLLLSYAHLRAQPRLECEKKWGEAKFKGKQIKRYRLRADDFPEGQRFRLVVKWFNGEEADTIAYVANRRGHLILEQERKDDPLYALCPLKMGERIAFLMRCEEDSSCCAEASVVPFPLMFKTRSGLELSLELKGQDGDAFYFWGQGFKSREKVDVRASFQGKDYAYRVNASSTGEVNFPFSLQMDDRDGGECVLTVKRDQEEVPLSFQAGGAALELAGGFVLEIR